MSHHFDAALVEVVLPDASSFALAEIAANENTQVLLMSGQPNATARPGQFDLACLPKPFDLILLRVATELVMAEHRRNAERIKDGMAWYRANLLALADMRAKIERVIGVSRHILAKATPQMPKQGS